MTDFNPSSRFAPSRVVRSPSAAVAAATDPPTRARIRARIASRARAMTSLAPAVPQPTMPDDDAHAGDLLEIIPLGAGSEVGRSCVIARYKQKTLMFDCGIHPGYAGLASLPYFDEIDLADVDALFVTHFHLDHCAAVPFLCGRTDFNGRIFMTHPTKAIYHMLMQDFCRLLKNQEPSEQLFGEKDLEASMKKIEVIDFHQEVDVDGVKVTPYRAGHVLGACMFNVDIGGLRVLYTGDYSRIADRHLPAADVPAIPPHVVIVESTYGVSPHSPREEREIRFTEKVQTILRRGGRVLLPVVALGRAQELLLILEDFWAQNPDLQRVPIYQASALARKAMTIYQTYINVLNSDMKAAFEEANPFVFNHVKHVSKSSELDDVGPCVVLATPSMLQSGLSRELFESWCEDPKNGVIIADFAVQGTLAREILSDVNKIIARDGRELQLNMSVDAISFSAHADYPQTQAFLDALAPPHVILVHGEAGEMGRLKRALDNKAAADDKKMSVYTPKNCQPVEIIHKGERIAKITGLLAEQEIEEGDHVAGVLVQKDFGTMLIAPEDVNNYTKLRTSLVTQRQLVPSKIPISTLRFALEALFEGLHVVSTLAPEEDEEEEEDAEEEANKPAAKKKAAPKKKATTSRAKKAKTEPSEVEAREGEDKFDVDKADGLSINDGMVTIRKRFADEITGVEHVVIEWNSDPLTDMIVDATLSAILQLESEPEALKEAEAGLRDAIKKKDETSAEKWRLRVVAAMLSAQFGELKVNEKKATLSLNIDGIDAVLEYRTRTVLCDNDALKQRVETTVSRIDEAIGDAAYAHAVHSLSASSTKFA